MSALFFHERPPTFWQATDPGHPQIAASFLSLARNWFGKGPLWSSFEHARNERRGFPR